MGVRMLREQPHKQIDALLPMLHQLLLSEKDPGEMQICPVCGQELKIFFTEYVEIPGELDISADCKACNFNVFFKSNRIPSWVNRESLIDGRNFLDRRES